MGAIMNNKIKLILLLCLYPFICGYGGYTGTLPVLQNYSYLKKAKDLVTNTNQSVKTDQTVVPINNNYSTVPKLKPLNYKSDPSSSSQVQTMQNTSTQNLNFSQNNLPTINETKNNTENTVPSASTTQQSTKIQPNAKNSTIASSSKVITPQNNELHPLMNNTTPPTSSTQTVKANKSTTKQNNSNTPILQLKPKEFPLENIMQDSKSNSQNSTQIVSVKNNSKSNQSKLIATKANPATTKKIQIKPKSKTITPKKNLPTLSKRNFNTPKPSVFNKTPRDDSFDKANIVLPLSPMPETKIYMGKIKLKGAYLEYLKDMKDLIPLLTGVKQIIQNRTPDTLQLFSAKVTLINSNVNYLKLKYENTDKKYYDSYKYVLKLNKYLMDTNDYWIYTTKYNKIIRGSQRDQKVDEQYIKQKLTTSLILINKTIDILKNNLQDQDI